MNKKLTPAQIEALYSAYKADKDGQKWIGTAYHLKTLKRLEELKLIESYRDDKYSPYLRITIAGGYSEAAELGFFSRYTTERNATELQKDSYEKQQFEWRKLLKVVYGIDPPQIEKSDRWGVQYWIVRFPKGVTVSGHADYKTDTVEYSMIVNAVIKTNHDLELFQRDLARAVELLTRLQNGEILVMEIEAS